MEKPPLISVIVPIYNVELYLRDCIESILNQSYRELEIILVNDGSTDGCLEICQEYEKLDTRIRLISKKNGGVVSARKAGGMAARGDFIGCVDADDWIEKDMYQMMYEKGILYDADLVCVSAYKSYADGKKEEDKVGIEEGIYEKGDIREKILPNWINYKDFFEWLLPLHMWRHLFKRELFLGTQLKVDDKIEKGEDIACCFPCYLRAERLCIIDKCLYYYRQRDDSAKRSFSKDKNIGYRLIYEQVNQSIEEFGSMKAMLKQQVLFLLFFCMLLCSDDLFLECNDIAFPFRIPKHSDVIVYGAGVFGKNIYLSFNRMNICNIKLWVDSDYKEYEKVAAPIEILKEEYEYILLAVMKPKSREVIRRKLLGLGVEEKKIIEIDQSLFTQQYMETILNRII